MKKNNIIIFSLLLLLTIGIVTFNYSYQLVALFVEGAAPNPGHSLTEIEGGDGLATKVYVDNALSSITGSNWTVSGTNIYRSSGNVGIGTTAPARKLHIDGSDSARGQISLAQGGTVATDSSAGIYWHTGPDYGIYRTPGTWTAATYQQLKIDWPAGIILEPGTGNNTGYDKSYVEITGGKGLRVTQGNVGIGTASPTAKLEVNGEIKIGSSGKACNSTTAGSIIYKSNVFYGCDGSSWVAMSHYFSDFYSAIINLSLADKWYVNPEGWSGWLGGQGWVEGTSHHFGFNNGTSEANNWIIFELAHSISINKYTIMSAYNHSGYNYTGNTALYGSNDQVTWTELARGAACYCGNNCSCEKDFPITDPTNYRFYKVTLYGNTRGAYQHFGYMKFE